MYRISKEFHFSASHQLHDLPRDHPCGRVHGHNYIVKVILIAEQTNEHGFVLDYNDMKPFGQWIDDTLDHRHLNDVMEDQPSAENMARALCAVVKDMLDLPQDVTVCVAVSETPKTWAEWCSI